MILSVVSKQTTDTYIKRKDLIAYESVIEYFIIHTPLRFTSSCPSATGRATFGEPRPNHFHGGIDIKTEREVNLASMPLPMAISLVLLSRNTDMGELS